MHVVCFLRYAHTPTCHALRCGSVGLCRSSGLPSPGDMACLGGAAELAAASQRLHGSTVHRPGLCVFPARGRALVFWWVLATGRSEALLVGIPHSVFFVVKTSPPQ